MPTTTPFVASLIPLAGALILTFRGLRRMRARRDRTPYVPPQPKELVTPSGVTLGSRTQYNSTCQDCGTVIPATDRICLPCARTREGPPPSAWHRALHWLVFFASMGLVFGFGAFLAS